MSVKWNFTDRPRGAFAAARCSPHAVLPPLSSPAINHTKAAPSPEHHSSQFASFPAVTGELQSCRTVLGKSGKFLRLWGSLRPIFLSFSLPRSYRNPVVTTQAIERRPLRLFSHAPVRLPVPGLSGKASDEGSKGETFQPTSGHGAAPERSSPRRGRSVRRRTGV